MQAHTSRALRNTYASGLQGQNQRSTGATVATAAGAEQPDQYTAPYQEGFRHALVVEPDSGAEQPAEAALPQPSSVPAGVFHFGCKRPVQISEAALSVGRKLVEPESGAEQPAKAALPQPSNVPAGVFHFGCKRPVQISEAALSVGRKLAEKGQWGLIRMAEQAASAMPPDLQHAEGRQGTSLQAEEPVYHQPRLHPLSPAERRPSETEGATHCHNSVERGENGAGNAAEPEQVTHWPERPAPEAACYAPSVLAASLQGDLVEPDSSKQHVTKGGSMTGHVQASGSPGDQASLHQSDQAPGSPDHSACPEPGAFLGSAGIAMSSWGESQLLALPSLAQHAEDDQQRAVEADSPVQVPQVMLASPPGSTMQIYDLTLLSTRYLLQDIDGCNVTLRVASDIEFCSQDNMDGQPQAAPEAAGQSASHTQPGQSSQAGPSQHQKESTPQLEATLQCGALGAAQSTELGGAVHQESASYRIPCSSVPSQHEAPQGLPS